MPTTLTGIETFVAAIPAEEDAAFVAQAGERPRTTSSAGTVELAPDTFTLEAIDELNARIFPPGQLHELEEVGVAQADFTVPGVGTFTALAGAITGDRWLEIRKRKAAPAIPIRPIPAQPVPVSSSPMPVPPPMPAVPAAPVPVPAQAAAAPAVPVAALDLEDLNDLTSLGIPERHKAFADDDLVLTDEIFSRPAVPANNMYGRDPVMPGITPAATRRRRSFSLRSSGIVKAGMGVAVSVLAGLMVWGYFAASSLTLPFGRKAAAPSRAAASTTRPSTRANVAPTKAAAPQPAAAPAATPPSPAPPSAIAPTAPPATAVPAAVTPAAAPVAPAALPASEPSRSGFSVQVTAVRARGEAEGMVRWLVAQGYPAYIVRGEGASADLNRVRVGTFEDRNAAEDVAKQIQGITGVKPWIATEIPTARTTGLQTSAGPGSTRR